MNGRDLGHYRIDGQLGAGGMGAVYRAVDLRNGEPVALKTLLASRLHDTEQRKRFQQEARLASSLHHPNIVSILEIGSSMLDGECVDFIVMELVDGYTLDKFAGDKPLTQAQAIDFGIQIAHGLAAAHAANIVHRDLKPSNLMVTRDGVVKILDFGLAKWTDPLETDALGDTRSVQLALTMSGTIIGSVAYMSPEQAEGKPLDSRADVFSFGAVLYRLVTGKQPFEGGSQVATLSAVLLKDPEPLSDLVPTLDPRFERIVSKCLRKDPAKRWQSMADLGLSLEELRDELNHPRGAPEIIAMPLAAVPSRRQWLLTGAALLTGLAPTVYFATRKPPSATFQRLTFRRGDVLSAQFAPRGEIVYTADWDGSPQASFSALPGSREARDLGLPAGRILSVNSNSEALMLQGDGVYGTLVRVGLGGGAARPVLDKVFDAAWGPDGNSIAVVRFVDGVNRLEYPIGTVRHTKQGRPSCWLRVNPVDRSVAFFDFDSEVGDFDLKTVDASNQIKLLSRGWRTVGRLAWSPDSSEVWMSGGRPGENPRLAAVTRDGKERVLAQLPGFMVLHDVSSEGAMLVADVRSKIAINALVPQSKDDVDLSWFDASLICDITRNGQTILFLELAYGEGRNSAIYLRKTDGSPAVKIGYGNRPALSPDGSLVVCIFHQNGSTVVKLLPTGAGEERTLATAGMKYDNPEWFPDQQRLLITASAPGKPLRTYWRSLDDATLHPITPEGVRASKVSPDGRWTLAAIDGKYLAYPTDGREPKDVGGAQPDDRLLGWNETGTAFHVARPRTAAVDVDVVDIATRQRRKVREIKFPEDDAEFQALVVTPDAKYFALSYQKDLAELYVARGLG